MNKTMTNYETMLKMCMIGVPVFTVLATLCAFGWNYYGLKIKQEEKKIQSATKTSAPPTIQNVFVEGDVVYGNKSSIKNSIETVEKLKVEQVPEEDVLLDVYNINNRPNPYFKYKNGDFDFQYLVNAVGNSVGYLLSTTFTLVRVENGKPIDFKVFDSNELSGSDLIYKDKPMGFGKQVSNLTEPLINNAFAVIDIKYTDTKRKREFVLRKIYSLNSKYAKVITYKFTQT